MTVCYGCCIVASFSTLPELQDVHVAFLLQEGCRFMIPCSRLAGELPRRPVVMWTTILAWAAGWSAALGVGFSVASALEDAPLLAGPLSAAAIAAAALGLAAVAGRPHNKSIAVAWGSIVLVAMLLTIAAMNVPHGLRGQLAGVLSAAGVGVVGTYLLTSPSTGWHGRAIAAMVGGAVFVLLLLLSVSIGWTLAQPFLLGGLSDSPPVIVAVSWGLAGAICGLPWGYFVTRLVRRA